MPFLDFRGNRRIVDRLQVKLKEGRFPHGLIFSGPVGIGKHTCAEMVAKALNCIRAGSADFCGECPHCLKIAAGVHPDVSAVTVEEEASEIKIAQVRDILHTLEMRPLEGASKVFIIDPAEKMKASASNALLKGLEEPPENTYFILVTTNVQELLVTVRSRSQTYSFTPLPMEEIRAFGSDDLLARWARGSIGVLKSLDVAVLRQRREAVLSFFEMAARADESELKNLLSASGDLSRAKQGFDSYLEMMTVLLEDLLFVREGLTGRIVNIDIETRLAGLAADIPEDRIVEIADFVRTMEALMKNYVNRQLMTDVLGLATNTMLGKIAHDNPGKSR